MLFFVCLRLVTCMPNVVSFSRLPYLIAPSVLSTVYVNWYPSFDDLI
jgi:hypothetical protein